MHFFTLLSSVLTLPLVAFSLPSQLEGNVGLEARDEDWKIELGWDGTVSPIETVGSFFEERDVNEQLEKRNPGGLYFCQAFNFVAPCAYVQFGNSGDCLVLSNTWRYSISSVGPDPATSCFLYWSQNCTGTSSANINNPGGNLQGAYGGNPNYWGQWNDYTGSIRCYF